MNRPGRLTVGLIGRARELPVLGLALAGADHIPWAITEPAEVDRERVNTVLPDIDIRSVNEIIAGSDLVVLAPGDGETLAGLVADGDWRAGQIVLHAGLSNGISALGPAQDAGAIVLAVSPVVTFTGTSLDLVRMRDGYCAITAPAAALPIAQALALEMGCEPFVVAEDDRAVFADAVTAVAEFSRAIVDQSSFRLAEIGVENPGRVLRAMALAAVDDALRQTADGATDPVDDWLGRTGMATDDE